MQINRTSLFGLGWLSLLALALVLLPDSLFAFQEAAEPDGRWFDSNRLNVLLILALYGVMVIWYMRKAKSGDSVYIRPIPGIAAIEEAIGRATEMGRPVLYVPGVEEIDNIQTIYSMIILEYVAQLAAQYDTELIVPIGKAVVTPIAEETVKQGYVNAGRPDAFVPGNVRYLSDEQFAYTAGISGIIAREKPAANIYLGSFYAESLILAENGYVSGAVQVAGTANIHQLPFFVVACDYALIGEEFFATTAYLGRDPSLLGTIKATDMFKLGILAYLLVGLVLETMGISVLSTLLLI
jgi:hypothetical protein